MLTCQSELHASYPQYLWYPGVLANVSTSAERLGEEYFQFLQKSPKVDKITKWVEDAITRSLGIYDATDEEMSLLVDHPELSPYRFADMVSRRAQTGWSTHGHSGEHCLLNSLMFRVCAKRDSCRCKHLHFVHQGRCCIDWKPREHRSRRVSPKLS